MRELSLYIAFLLISFTSFSQQQSKYDEYFINGSEEYRAKNYELAESKFLKSSQLGTVRAMVMLGEVYSEKDFTGYNLEKANKWYLEAIKKDSTYKYLFMKVALNYSRINKNDFEGISELMLKSVEDEPSVDSKSEYKRWEQLMKYSNSFHENVGNTYSLGENESNLDFAKAVRFYEKVQPKGMVGDRLGILYFNGGYGLNPNHDKAFANMYLYIMNCKSDSTYKYQDCKKDSTLIGRAYYFLYTLQVSAISNYSNKKPESASLYYNKCKEFGYEKCQLRIFN